MSHVANVAWCPIMVSLRQKVEERTKICGGTVLTQTLTLTAAHCLISGIMGLNLAFGSVFLDGGNSFQATNIVLHELFNESTLAHDVGLVSIFPAIVTFGLSIQPVKLPVKFPVKDIFGADVWMDIYGWGAISDQKYYSEVLRCAKLPIVDQKVCKILHNNEVPVNTFCLGFLDGHIDACLGDSGGPAIFNGTQFGITSFGDGCAMPLKPGVYTDLRKYVDWLNIAIKHLV